MSTFYAYTTTLVYYIHVLDCLRGIKFSNIRHLCMTCNFVAATTNTYSVSYFAKVVVLSLLHLQLTSFRTIKFKIQFFIFKSTYLKTGFEKSAAKCTKTGTVGRNLCKDFHR